MNIIKITATIALLVTMVSASAIPPPEALVSIWQSALQMLGIASVFIASAYFSVKQFFSVYFMNWTRGMFALAGAGLLLPFVLWFVYSNYFGANKVIKFVPPTSIEHITIEETIARDPDEDVREWKLKTLKEMKQEADFARTLKKHPPLIYQTLPSFSPQTLYEEMKKDRSKFYLLDVREAYERSKFYMPYDASIRYGDVLDDFIPPKLAKSLPHDKQIIVLCHSGLRGYITANMLVTLTGNKNIAFLQGGLRGWDQQKLPINGNEDYSSEPVKKPVYTKSMVEKATNVLKVYIEANKKSFPDFADIIHLPFEIATSADVNNLIERSKTKPIIIICSSFIGCFHSNSFSYLVEKSGGKVIGIYDTSNEFVIPPIIYND